MVEATADKQADGERRGEKDGQSRGERREAAGGRGQADTEGGERETYYSHRLITMYSPTLTATRLSAVTPTPETCHWPKGGLISANGRSAEIL